MALTRDYKETVIARIKRDRKFARALYAESINALLAGETAEGLSMLRDLVHAEITFKELARQTGLGEKTLHRMLNRRGNQTARGMGRGALRLACGGARSWRRSIQNFSNGRRSTTPAF